MRKSLSRKLEWAAGKESCQKIVWPASPECGKAASRWAEDRKQSSSDGGWVYPGTVDVEKEASSHFPARAIFRSHSDSLRQAGLSLEAQRWLICTTKNPRWKTGNRRRDKKKNALVNTHRKENDHISFETFLISAGQLLKPHLPLSPNAMLGDGGTGPRCYHLCPGCVTRCALTYL